MKFFPKKNSCIPSYNTDRCVYQGIIQAWYNIDRDIINNTDGCVDVDDGRQVLVHCKVGSAKSKEMKMGERIILKVHRWF